VPIAGFYWNRQDGFRMVGKVTGSLTVDHKLYCMTNCSSAKTCDSYNFREADNACQLNTHDSPLVANSTDLVEDTAWGWWKNTFTTLVGLV
jgi:hypothetical protein